MFPLHLDLKGACLDIVRTYQAKFYFQEFPSINLSLFTAKFNGALGKPCRYFI